MCRCDLVDLGVPAWDGKRDDIAESFTVLREPVSCVVSGATCLICSQFQVAMLPLGPQGGHAGSTDISWRDDLGLLDYVVVDAPKSRAIRAERTLLTRPAGGVGRWEGPLPSPGSWKDEARVVC